ncbi:transposase [Myxococcus faecalis]|nr:transposase [Myxococcus sp. AS-1-15]MBZ4412832.1 transposase [Myxococcus sp. XM-1-1-1]BDT32646.1 transposase [Myxococcus sp. MH1]
MVPTLTAALGLKGERPLSGTRDCKDVVHTIASVNTVTGEITSRLYGSRTRTRRKDGLSKTKRMQVAFAHHLLDVARTYPADVYAAVVIIIDNAPWHRGRPVDWALQRYPHQTLYRLPSYSPQLQSIERLWRPLRQFATHNVLFDELTQLLHALRSGLGYFRARPQAVLRLLGSRWSPSQSAEA